MWELPDPIVQTRVAAGAHLAVHRYNMTCQRLDFGVEEFMSTNRCSPNITTAWWIS